MNYIKPEDIKEYVSKNPEGIAGMSEELAVMVNHFAKLIVKECAQFVEDKFDFCGDEIVIAEEVRKHFGVE